MSVSDDRQDEKTLSLIERQAAEANVDTEPKASNERVLGGAAHWVVACGCVAYSVFHLVVLNVWPLETWAFRLSRMALVATTRQWVTPRSSMRSRKEARASTAASIAVSFSRPDR